MSLLASAGACLGVQREGWERRVKMTGNADQVLFPPLPLTGWPQEALSFHFLIYKMEACSSYLLLKNKLLQNLVT